MRVIACIDDGPAARPVLRTAKALSVALGARAEALHVREDGIEGVRAHAAAMRVPLSIQDAGRDPVDGIVEAAGASDVALVVLGARSAGEGWRPAGHVALAVSEQTSKPLVVVPPDVEGLALTGIHRLLVPLDGSEEAAIAMGSAVHLFARSGVEVVVLHVFDRTHLPAFLDRPEHDLGVWAQEFLARQRIEQGARIEIRTGDAGGVVVRTAEEIVVDMIALAWSQDLSPGHADVVRDVLTRTHVPILLIPAVGTILLPEARTVSEAR